MSIRVYSWALLIVLVAGWELFCRLSGISALVIPAPSAVLETTDSAAGYQHLVIDRGSVRVSTPLVRY